MIILNTFLSGALAAFALTDLHDGDYLGAAINGFLSAFNMAIAARQWRLI